MNTEEDLLRNLRSPDIDAEGVERIRREAHAILGTRAKRANAGRAWSRIYFQLVEPAVLIGLSLAFLVWTVQDTVALYP
jgi:hypothetical protein